MDEIMTLVDTNIIVRYLVGDGGDMADEARELIEGGLAYTYPEGLAEGAYVLTGIYGLTRTQICTGFRTLMKHVHFYDRDVLITAFNFYEYANIDFVDALLVGRAIVNGESVTTFDKKVSRILGAV